MKHNYRQTVRVRKLTALNWSIIFLLLFSGSITAQVSTLKLSTTNSSSYLDITDNSNNSLLRMRGDGRMGINQNTPTAGLHLVSDDGLLVQGTYSGGNTWNLGAGVRMHWYSRWGSFRVGGVDGTQWNEANVGVYSFASGYNTTASLPYSTAMGFGTTASGNSSTAMGKNTYAIGNYSTAMGFGTTASGNYSTTMGNITVASGWYSTAMGYNTTASGSYSTAMGKDTYASGYYSTAMGDSTSASGNNSTAMGNKVVAIQPGSFIIGDDSNIWAYTFYPHQMVMRFAGGYWLYSNSGQTTGVYMPNGVSGWSNYSDRNKKENFRSIDGELLLKKISDMPITEWNYKETDESIRYIGPMAQDFYAAFHLGGTDSLGINSIAIDGVNMAAIQSLIKRTDELKKKTEELKTAQKRIDELENEVTLEKDELSSQKIIINRILNELVSVKNDISKLGKENGNMVVLNKERN